MSRYKIRLTVHPCGCHCGCPKSITDISHQCEDCGVILCEDCDLHHTECPPEPEQEN